MHLLQNRFAMAEQAINAIYQLADRPELIMENVLMGFYAALQTEKPTQFSLSRFSFTAGHVAIRHLAYMELLEKELKRRKPAEEGFFIDKLIN